LELAGSVSPAGVIELAAKDAMAPRFFGSSRHCIIMPEYQKIENNTVLLF
jgi:hypothetical protein